MSRVSSTLTLGDFCVVCNPLLHVDMDFTNLNLSDLDVKSDAAWLRGLGASLNSNVRTFVEHVRAVDGAFSGETDMCSPFLEVHEMRRGLMALLNSQKSAIGLPSALPRYIAVCNLSGKRCAFYSSSSALIRRLCVTDDPATSKNVSTLVSACEASKGTQSLVLYYSLPWQIGAYETFWELRTLRQTGAPGGAPGGAPAVMDDGLLTTIRSVVEPACAANTSDVDVADPALTAEVAKRMAKFFVATCLDEVSDATGTSGCNGSNGSSGSNGSNAFGGSEDGPGSAAQGVDANAASKISALQSIISAMKTSRNEVISERNELKRDYEEQLRTAYIAGDSRVDQVQKAADKKIDFIESSLKQSREFNNTLVKQIEEAQQKRQNLESALAEAQLLAQTEQQSLKEKVKKLTANLKASQDETSNIRRTLGKQHDDAVDALTAQVEALTREVNTSKAALVSERKQASLQAKAISQLNDVVQKMKNVNEAAAFEEEQSRKRSLGNVLLLRLCRTQLETAKVRLRDAVKRAENAEAKAEQALAKPETRDAETLTIYVTPRSEIELGELQNLYSKLLERTSELEASLAAAKEEQQQQGQQGQQGQQHQGQPHEPQQEQQEQEQEQQEPPASQEDHQMVTSSEVSYDQDPPSDEATEALASNLNHSIRLLLNLARSASAAKTHATALEYELEALKRAQTSMMTHAPLLPPPPPPLQSPMFYDYTPQQLLPHATGDWQPQPLFYSPSPVPYMSPLPMQQQQQQHHVMQQPPSVVMTHSKAKRK